MFKGHLPFPSEGQLNGFGGPLLGIQRNEAWANEIICHDRLTEELVGVRFVERLTKRAGGAQIRFNREVMAHTSVHTINITLGQELLRSGWASGRSSPRPGPAGMTWPPPPHGSAREAAGRISIPILVGFGISDPDQAAPSRTAHTHLVATARGRH